MPLCGDDEEALATARTLAEAVGCAAIPAGGLDRADLLESAALFVIGLWFGGADARSVIPPLEHAFG
ncbi:hypothetical protein [Streptomyces zagrosensis]|uniref:Putative dinucleotide-binding enzyme n=1 Tax=Streptomyces zagrosensis TaxID=1042984 RepID=A0A7W9V2L1_9ACTN|nr:hypothetical protein [Streptomyces zagrosensis]MBB5939406.1 putative dinucleotide-binding enzyme [Streptomyces zagrosensis]